MDLTDLIPGVSEAKLIGIGAVAAAVVGIVGFGVVQTARLHHAKADLDTARAALIDPTTKKTWQSEAVAAQRDLKTCQGNETAMQGAIDGQNASIEALKQEAAAASARATAQIRAAEAHSADAAREAAQIMAKRPGGDLCASALQLMREP